MSLKISFMHYMKWIRVMLPVIFEEFELVCIFLISFSSHYRCQFIKGHYKRSTLAKIWGAEDPRAPPGLYRSVLAYFTECLFIRSSRTEVFCRKGVLRNFAKCTGKLLCLSLFCNKVAGLWSEACNFIKKRL